MMKTFWLVESRYCDDGAVTVCLSGSIQAEDCPNSEKLSASEMDIYRDWFDSRAAADRLMGPSVKRRYGGRHE